MEDGRREYGVSPGLDGGHEVLERARSPAGNERYRADLVHGSNQFEIEAVSRAVSIDRVDEQFAGTAFDGFSGPDDTVEIGLGSAAVGGHHESRRRAIRSLEIEGQH